MRLIRSWPAQVPEGRSYVVDDIDRLIMEHYDYRCLDAIDDDIVLIEWDLAVDGPQLETFIARAAADPEQTRVAPYLLYPASSGNRTPFYCHRVKGPGANRWVTGPEDEFCHMFGFGLVYLPRAMVVGFLKTLKKNRRFSDVTFSYWHWRHGPRDRREVPIDWDVRPVHLHYDPVEVPPRRW